MTSLQAKTIGTVIAAGVVIAVVAGITYLMGLIVFSQEALAWTFFGGLLAAGVAAFGAALLSIWNS